jgi:hypothetical protein
MPTNLPPEYSKIEARYREATEVPEKIMYLEEMLSVIPKHKGTDKLRADLRRKLSKLKDASASRKGTSRQASPYQVEREGAGQVAVVGPPNVGKSTLVDALTNADVQIGEYPFSTTVPVPGMMPYENIQFQLIDTPPLSEEFEEPQLMHLMRLSDLVCLMIDLQAFPIEQLNDSLAMMREHRLIPVEERDSVPEDQRHRFSFKPILVVVNKADDAASDDDFEVLCELLGELPCPLLPIAAKTGRNLDTFGRTLFERLDIVRVYSKPPGKDANFDAPFVMPRGGTLENFAAKVHKDFVESLRSARVWGEGVYDGQQVGREHVLHDGDVVELKA